MTPDGVPVTVPVAQPGRSNAIVGLIIGVAVTTFAVLMFAVIGVFWPQFSDWANCDQGTNTTQGHQSCTDQFEQAVKDRLGQK